MLTLGILLFLGLVVAVATLEISLRIYGRWFGYSASVTSLKDHVEAIMFGGFHRSKLRFEIDSEGVYLEIYKLIEAPVGDSKPRPACKLLIKRSGVGEAGWCRLREWLQSENVAFETGETDAADPAIEVDTAMDSVYATWALRCMLMELRPNSATPRLTIRYYGAFTSAEKRIGCGH